MLCPEEEKPKKIYMLLGASDSSLLAETVPWKTIGAKAHFALPELTLRKSPLYDKSIITGSMGINPLVFENKKTNPVFRLRKLDLANNQHFYNK